MHITPVPSRSPAPTSPTGLEPYREEFRRVIVEHMQHRLPKQEWHQLRVRAGRARALALTPASLAAIALSEDAISVSEVLIPAFERACSTIGIIAGQPVHYIVGHGIYLWGLEPQGRWSLSLWITSPAYPPGW